MDASKIIDQEFDSCGRYLEDSGIGIHTSEQVVRFDGDAKGNVKKVITDKACLTLTSCCWQSE